MYPMTLVEQVGRLTLEATGSANATKTLTVARSSAPFKNLSITVIPTEASNYTVEVFHFGQLAETHTYSSGDTIAEMAYPDYIFPANVGTNSKFQEYGISTDGLDITVRLTNNGSALRVFGIVVCFETYENAQFAILK